MFGSDIKSINHNDKSTNHSLFGGDIRPTNHSNNSLFGVDIRATNHSDNSLFDGDMILWTFYLNY